MPQILAQLADLGQVLGGAPDRHHTAGLSHVPGTPFSFKRGEVIEASAGLIGAIGANARNCTAGAGRVSLGATTRASRSAWPTPAPGPHP
jgi:hypothetical protein